MDEENNLPFSVEPSNFDETPVFDPNNIDHVFEKLKDMLKDKAREVKNNDARALVNIKIRQMLSMYLEVTNKLKVEELCSEQE